MQLTFWTFWRPQVMSIQGKENDVNTVRAYYKTLYSSFNETQIETLLEQYFSKGVVR